MICSVVRELGINNFKAREKVECNSFVALQQWSFVHIDLVEILDFQPYISQIQENLSFFFNKIFHKLKRKQSYFAEKLAISIFEHLNDKVC